jgi:hypothetical protein
MDFEPDTGLVIRETAFMDQVGIIRLGVEHALIPISLSSRLATIGYEGA